MIDLNPVAKVFILAGALTTVIGVLFLFLDKIPWLGNLPGDIYIQRKNFSIYLPITTCIIISVILSLIFYFLTRR